MPQIPATTRTSPVDCGGILSPLTERLIEAAAIDAFILARRAGRSPDEALAEFEAAAARGAGLLLQLSADQARLAPDPAPGIAP